MLLENCKKLVQSNITKSLDDKAIEIMQYVVAALILEKEQIATERLPRILQELQIYAENRSILEMSHEYLNNYDEDNLLSRGNACVTRRLSFDNETFLGEHWYLLLSLSKHNDTYQIISTLTHEFMHLLRHDASQQDGIHVKIRSGISINYLDSQKGKLRKKHQILEEGIVQKYTYEALKELYDYLKEQKIETEIAKDFIKGYDSEKFEDYLLERSMLETLCRNQKFLSLVETSFTDPTIPSPVTQYFNTIMGSSNALTELENCLEAIQNSSSEMAMQSYYIKACSIAATFLNKCMYHR